MLIDCHTHIFPPQVISGREDYLKQEAWFAHLYGSPGARMASAEELIREMDRCGVDRSVVCGFAWESFDLYVETNTYLAEAVSRYPDRLIGFANVPPMHKGAVAELERCLDLGLTGLGELKADGQSFDLDDDAPLEPVLGFAAARGLPVLLHVSEPVGRLYPGKGGTSPRKAFNFALRHPDLKLIYAHWGGGLIFYELMPDVRGSLANVWYDCSASPYLYDPEIYRVAVTAAGSGKILFGSDYPLISPERYLQELDAAGLATEDREALLGGSAAALFGLADR
jgi:uncharacterized protein